MIFGACHRPWWGLYLFHSWKAPKAVAVVVPILLLMKWGLEFKSLALWHSQWAAGLGGLAPDSTPNLGCKITPNWGLDAPPNLHVFHSFSSLQHCIQIQSSVWLSLWWSLISASWQEREFLVSLLFAYIHVLIFTYLVDIQVPALLLFTSGLAFLFGLDYLKWHVIAFMIKYYYFYDFIIPIICILD